MSTSVHVSSELAARLSAEARRRGVDVDTLSAELLEAGLLEDDALETFIGSGRSGREDLGRDHRRIAAARTRPSARDL